MELVIAVDNVGQAPKVEDLARSEGVGYDRELTREADTTSGVVPLAPTTRRVAPTTIEPESHLMMPPTWHASCHRVETMTSMLFESVSEYGVSGGSGGLRNTIITQTRRNGLS